MQNMLILKMKKSGGGVSRVEKQKEKWTSQICSTLGFSLCPSLAGKTKNSRVWKISERAHIVFCNFSSHIKNILQII